MTKICAPAARAMASSNVEGIGSAVDLQSSIDTLNPQARYCLSIEETGSNTYRVAVTLILPDGTRAFRFIDGPIFCQLLMADEINRASPRTQSALLQAMQERHVTVAGHRHELPRPFHVLATQNPLEQEGTYPLPEAQLDRFLMQIDVNYPDMEAERRMLLETTGDVEATATAVMRDDDVEAAQRLVRRMPVGESVVDAILQLVRSARPEETDNEEVRDTVAWGPGPRASQALMLAVRARALMDGRYAPSVDDVVELADPILRHRMALSFAARAEGTTVSGVIDRLCTPFR